MEYSSNTKSTAISYSREMIYFDANASSRTRLEVIDGLKPLLVASTPVSNPSGIHAIGRESRNTITSARNSLTKLISATGSATADIIFTSGATEACNAMVYGFLQGSTGHIICSEIEHLAVLEPVRRLEQNGWLVSWVSPDSEGFVDPDSFVRLLRPETQLVSLMAANNETGAVQPIVELCQRLRSGGYSGAIVSDYTQALGKSRLPIKELLHSGINALAISGHKLGALTGVGALILNNSRQFISDFQPFIIGGAQEYRKRAGTENMLGIASLGIVAELLLKQSDEEIVQLEQLREAFWTGLLSHVTDISRLTPIAGKSLSNTLLVSFAGCRGDDLVAALDVNGLCASFGSACSSGKQEMSHVLAAMGVDASEARSAVRFSLDWDATQGSVENAINIIAVTVKQIRGSDGK